MNAHHIVFIGLAAALAAGIVITQRTNAALRNEQAMLMPAANEIRQLRRANAAFAVPVDTREMERLRAETRELHALRNAVGQLTREKFAREKAAPPVTGVTASSAASFSLSTMPDYVALESLAYAGHATPEDSLRSYLAAIRQGDLKQYAACLAPEGRTWDDRALATATEEQIAKVVEELRQGIPFRGYRIAGRRTDGDKAVILFLQTETDEHLNPECFVKTDEGWKVNDAMLSKLIRHPASLRP